MANTWSRRSMISSLGDSGLPVFQAGHCDWQRPHSVQVAKSSRPFQVKCSTLPTPKTVVVRVGLLEVERLAACVIIGSSAPRAPSGARLVATLIGASEDVQVLGVGDDHQEADDHARSGRARRRSRCASLAVSPSGSQRLGRRRRRRTPTRRVAEREDAGVDLRRRGSANSVKMTSEDHAEDDPGGAGVRAVEAATPARRLAGALRSRMIAKVTRPTQHRDARRSPRGSRATGHVPISGMWKSAVEQRAVRLDDRQRRG